MPKTLKHVCIAKERMDNATFLNSANQIIQETSSRLAEEHANAMMHGVYNMGSEALAECVDIVDFTPGVFLMAPLTATQESGGGLLEKEEKKVTPYFPLTEEEKNDILATYGEPRYEEVISRIKDARGGVCPTDLAEQLIKAKLCREASTAGWDTSADIDPIPTEKSFLAAMSEFDGDDRV